MVWQDLVFTGGGFVLTAGLVPMLRAAERPPLRTSLTLLAVLSSYVVALASLGLWLSAAGTALQAAVWGVFAVQRMRIARGARRAADRDGASGAGARQRRSRTRIRRGGEGWR